MKTIDLAGKKFNLLTVVSQAPSDKAGAAWTCLCDCGETATVNSLKLRTGSTKSCGHLKADRIGLSNRTHGLANKTKTYRTWKEMRQRCLNPNATQWKWYGGRGVSICERWSTYENFLSDMGERPDGRTIDRKDSDGNYEPSNCRWATQKEQAVTNRGCFKPGFNANLSPASMAEMMPVLLGMLGLSGLRSFEKNQGVAAK